MKPYYEHNGITIYHGDCKEILPDLQATLLFTDPPFGSDCADHGMGGKQQKNGKWGGDSSERYFIHGNDDLSIGTYACEWAAQKDIPALVFASPYAPFPGKWRNLLVWDKGGAVGWGGDPQRCFKRTWELIQIARNGPLCGMRDESVIRWFIQPWNYAEHPCAKPIGLIHLLLAKLWSENMTVVDPFLGSGTTLVAAKKLNVLAIGIEIEEKYCEIAAKRLSQEVLQF
jgi:DNA modification methylase